MARSHLAGIESGKRQGNTRVLALIAKALGKEPYQLLEPAPLASIANSDPEVQAAALQIVEIVDSLMAEPQLLKHLLAEAKLLETVAQSREQLSKAQKSSPDQVGE